MQKEKACTWKKKKKEEEQQLQLIQNTAARIVTQERKFCNITPILKDLHWLLVAARIDFKVLLQVYKCLHGTAPEYLSSKLQKYACPKPNMIMRSAMDTLKLDQPSFKLNKFGYRAFSVAGPRIWNTVTSFKQALKTHLYRRKFFPLPS